MMAALHALVLDDEESMLGFVADALATFEPGFRVSTSRTLESATRRLTVNAPDVLIVRADAVPAPEWEAWVRVHDVNPGRIAVIGSSSAGHLAATCIPEPVSLPALLEAARELVAETHGYDPATDDVPELRVVQH